jgi:hypothetical protein
VGAHPVEPLSVHFAGACTGYGPITPGDRLAVFYMRIAPHAAMRTPSAAEGNGLSMLVAAGSLRVDGRSYAPWSCRFVTQQEGAATPQASDAGAEVLVLRYPRLASG